MASDDKIFPEKTFMFKLLSACFGTIERHVVWFRENVVLRNQKEQYWYHEKLRRVPTIDECYSDDVACIYEAEKQYTLDRKVDLNILTILRKRMEHCELDNVYDKHECKELRETFKKAKNNYFIKYGDLGYRSTALRCFMKQKNRMAWERRHGPVGSGKKNTHNESSPTS